MPNTLNNSNLNLPIQYLRGVAALLVVFTHFDRFPIINQFCGAIGVDIFFIISGYIMGITVPRYEGRSLAFILNRAIRIFPLYLIISAPEFLSKALNGQYFEILRSAFLFNGTTKGYDDPVLFSGWTLCYEFIFYLITILFVRKQRFGIGVLTIMGIIGLLPIGSMLGYFFNSFYLLFVAGLFLSHLMKHTDHTSNQSKAINLISSAVVLLIVMLFQDESETVSALGYYIPRQFVFVQHIAIPRILIWGLPAFYFTLSFVTFFENRNPIKPLMTLGNISYSIYLVHTFLIMLFMRVEHYFLNEINGVLFQVMYVITLLSVFPISMMTHYLIEVKLSAYLKSFIAQRN